MSVTLEDIRQANHGYFSPGNKKFFGDISYEVEMGQKTKTAYLVTYSNAWTDMFDGQKKPHYYVKPIMTGDLTIGPLIDKRFWTREELNAWLQQN